MSTKTIYLKLVGKNPSYQLQWSYDQRKWSKVQPNSPSTEVNSGDKLDWKADSSIDKLRITFAQGNVISNRNIRDNDSKEPIGTVKNGAKPGAQDSYTIQVMPADGGPIDEYDPDVKVPGGD